MINSRTVCRHTTAIAGGITVAVIAVGGGKANTFSRRI